MKAYLLVIVLALGASVANAGPFGRFNATPAPAVENYLVTPDLKPVAPEQQVSLPNDSNRLYVTVFAESDAQVKEIFAKNPALYTYAKGAHYKVYKKGDPIAMSRFKDASYPSAVVTRSNTNAELFRCGPFRQKDKEEEEVVDEDAVDTAPVNDAVPEGPEPLSAWVVIALAAVGIAAGAGFKAYQEITGK